MANSLLNLTIVGYVGKDPELRYTQQGKPVLSFSVAVNRSWKKNDEWMQETQWYKVTAWDEKAESLAKTVHKGQIVTVVSDWITIKEYTRSDGGTGIDVSIVAKSIVAADKPEKQEHAQEEIEDEIPF